MTERTNILIVDDDDDLCKSLSMILRLKGHTVAVALNGPQAIEQVRKRSFDLILLDVKMVPLDGVETCAEIKRIRPEALVMMMTAFAVEEQVQKALRLGASGVLYKPLDIKEMMALADRIS